MKNFIKNLFILIFVSSSLGIIKSNNSFFQILASEGTRVEINFGESFGIDQNIKNLKDRKNIYEKGIIDKVKEGRSNEYKLGRYIIGKRFFKEDYCKDIGEYSIIGTVPYVSWCHEDSGPFSLISNPESAFILPLTIELKSGFKKNLIDTLLDGLEADYIGVIKGHEHNPMKLAGPDFKFGQDQLFGLVDHTKKLMLLYEINDLGINQNRNFSKFSVKNSSYDLVINLIDKKGQVFGGVSFGENKKHCFNHQKKCLLNNIHLLEYHHKIHAPNIVKDKKWGYVTEELSPPHSLIKDYVSFQKIFLSRNYYLLIDINQDLARNVSSVEVKDIINE